MIDTPARRRLALHVCAPATVCLLLAVTGCQLPPAGGVEPQGEGASSTAPRLPARGTVVAPSTILPADFRPGGQVEVYGNYHTAGIVVGLTEKVPVSSVGRMAAYLNVNGGWRPVQEPVQVGKFAWFATSLFWLKPASAYQVKVEIFSRAGQRLATWYGEGATRAEPVIHESARKLFVAQGGDDGASGEMGAPFKTLAHAFATVQAGESIVIRGGTYYEGDLTLAAKSRPDAPIVIQAQEGEQVIISGADPAALDPSAWTRETNGLISYPCDATYVQACVEDLKTRQMLRLYATRRIEELLARRLDHTEEYEVGGTFEHLGIAGGTYLDGTRVYVSLPPGVKEYRIHLAKRRFGMDLDRRSGVQISGLEFRHIGREQPNSAIIIRNSSDILVTGCSFAYVDSHVYVKGVSDRVTVQDCTFVDSILDWPFGHMKFTGAGAPFEGGAVNVDANYSGRGLVVRRNFIGGIFDGLHLTPWLVDEARTQETDCYENTMDGCIDDFIEIDGLARNVRVFDNYMNRSLSGISLAQALEGPTYVIYNVIANCGMVKAATREGNYGYPFKTNGGNGGVDSSAGSGPIYFYHNTSYTDDPESRAMLVKDAKWRRITLRNNIWCGQKIGAEFWRGYISPMDFDYDDLYVVQRGGPLVLQQYRTGYYTLNAVQRRFGWLRHGLNVDPQLQGPSDGVYTLNASSPCIDAGIPLAGINEERSLGVAPDMGAYEAK